MNYNYHMARFIAQERIHTLRNEAQTHRSVQAKDSQTKSARFSLRLNRLYQQLVNWSLADFLASWQPVHVFRNFIFKHS